MLGGAWRLCTRTPNPSTHVIIISILVRPFGASSPSSPRDRGNLPSRSRDEEMLQQLLHLGHLLRHLLLVFHHGSHSRILPAVTRGRKARGGAASPRFPSWLSRGG